MIEQLKPRHCGHDGALAEQTEPAPAQDEREAFETRMRLEAGPGATDLWIKGNPDAGYANERVNDYRLGWAACLEWMSDRPAQTEQQPIYLYRRKGQDAFASCDLERFEELSAHRLFETKIAYAAPVAQTEMVEALGSMTCAYRMAIQAGHARITALGGECDSVEQMLADFPDYGRAVEMYKSARAALAQPEKDSSHE
jgi:hypothetical protein